MPRRKATTPANLLDLFTPERRQQLVDEALVQPLRSIIAGAKNFGHLVESLTKHLHWPHIRDLPVSSVLRAGGGSAAASGSPSGKRRGRPPGSKNRTSIAPAAASAGKVPSSAKRGRGFRTYTDADLAHVLEVIQAKQGLRPSEYQAASKLSEKVWENAVYKLKSDGKIKVVGKARGTSYVVA